MVDEEHGHEAQCDEQRGIREQDAVVDLAHERTGGDGRNDLRSHGGRVVIAGKFADIRALAHLDDHGKRVDVDRGPGKADEGEDDKHNGVDRGECRCEHIAAGKAGGKQDDAALDRALAADLRGDLADGDVRDDGARRGDEQAGRCAAEALPHDGIDIRREPRRHAVIADEPERDGGQQEAEALFDGLRERLVAAAVVLRKVPFRVLLFKRLIFRRELRLPDREEEHGDGDEHNGRHNDKQRLIVHMSQTGGLGVGIEHRRNAEIQNAADRAHQIDDGVRTRAQRLWRHVGHEGDGGSAVRSHGDEQQAEDDDK